MNKAHLGLMIGMISCIMASIIGLVLYLMMSIVWLVLAGIVLLLVSLLLVFIDSLHD